MKISLLTLYYLFVEIAFLFPRGYGEYSEIYHLIMTLLVWSAVMLITITEIPKIIKHSKRVSSNSKMIAVYFLMAIIITIVLQKGMQSGLQQMIATPIFCVFLIQNIKKRPQKLLDTLATVFIMNLSLNIVITRIAFVPNSHIIFLGHVQMVSQYGLAALVVSVLYYMTYKDKKIKMCGLVLLTVFTMLTTDADSAVFSALIIIIGFIVYKFKLYRVFFFKTEIYMFGMIAMNIAIVYLTAVNRTIIPGLDFSGRRFVWQDALLNIKAHPIFGYGIDGILLHTFWTEWSGGGFNYAHNQILQNLLDGGVMLTISFWIMIFAFIKPAKKIPEVKYRVFVNSSIIALLFVMIFDSTTLYSYMYVVLTIIHAVPFLRTEKSIKEKCGRIEFLQERKR